MQNKIIVDKLENGNYSKSDIVFLLNNKDEDIINYLFNRADEVRKKNVGDGVYLRAIIEFSNYCRKGCIYCGINRDMTNTARYRMTPKEIIAVAKDIYEAGYKTIILQSGEDIYYSKDEISKIIKEIKEKYPMLITLSMGERTKEEYEEWFSYGARRYLIKHETSNKEVFKKLHPNDTFKRRLECMKNLREIGYDLGSGFMIGLPFTTTEDIAEDILLLKKLNTEMAGIGPFICHPDTPLAGHEDGSALLTLKALAITRLILPKIHLPSTTALNVKGGLKDALNCGANVIMQKATPMKYQRLYDIYPNRPEINVSLLELREKTVIELKNMNKAVL
jgi:biotin synthase